MSRSAAAQADRSRALRPSRVLPRRVSGPLRASRAAVDSSPLARSDAALAPRPQPWSRAPGIAAGGAAIAWRVAGAAVDVSASRTMDRLVRSRAWVVIVAFGLIGIVAMQVSMLKLNAGIGRAVETVGTLERGNAALRSEISRLSSADRIQALAGARGFVMPEPADVTYLRAGSLRSDARRAARRMRVPDPGSTGPAGSTTVAPALGAAPAGGSAGAASAPDARAATAALAAAPAAPPAATTAAGDAATSTATGAPGASATAPETTAAGGVTVP